MKVLFVHEVSWFNKVVYEMHDIPELLSLRQHEVHFLDFDEGKPRTRWRTVTTNETRAHPGSRVFVTTPPRVFPGILGRLLAVVIQPLVFLLLCRRIRPDVVIVYSVPTSGWQIVSMCRLMGTPVIARVIDVPHVLRRTRFVRLVKIAERLVFTQASFISTHNQVLRSYCIERGASRLKSDVILPGCDTQRFFPAPPNKELQQKLNILPTHKVIVFMGTLFRFSGVFELINALAAPLREDPTLILLILGDGEDSPRLQALVRNLELADQVLLSGRIEYDSLADHLRLGHVAVLPFVPELATHGALPGKVLQYLACGLPTVATPLHGLQSIVLEGEGVVYASSSSDMARIAVQLLNEPSERLVLAKRGVELMNHKCNWGRQIEQFEQLFIRTIDF